MALNNVKCFLLRFNLDNEQHLRLYNRIRNLNIDIYKSKTQYIMDCMDAYPESMDKKVVIENSDEFLKEVNRETENAVARVLGQFIIGSTQVKEQDIVRVVKANKEEVKEGITNPDIQDMMNGWYDN